MLCFASGIRANCANTYRNKQWRKAANLWPLFRRIVHHSATNAKVSDGGGPEAFEPAKQCRPPPFAPP